MPPSYSTASPARSKSCTGPGRQVKVGIADLEDDSLEVVVVFVVVGHRPPRRRHRSSPKSLKRVARHSTSTNIKRHIVLRIIRHTPRRTTAQRRQSSQVDSGRCGCEHPPTSTPCTSKFDTRTVPSLSSSNRGEEHPPAYTVRRARSR
jgi:hypothetical protein